MLCGCVGVATVYNTPYMVLTVATQHTMGSQLVYGDGVEDIKDFFRGALPGDRRDGGLCTRPVVAGSVVILWLFCLSISLIVLSSKYQNLSTVSLSSRLDTVHSLHSANHQEAIQKIQLVDTQHKDTVNQLGHTVDKVEQLQGKVKESLEELKYFLAGLGKVADSAAQQLEQLRN